MAISERERQRIILEDIGCLVPGCRGTPELHHVRTAANSGTALKPDSKWLVPICRGHHIGELHQHGVKTFQATYGIDLIAVAMELAQIDGPMP